MCGSASAQSALSLCKGLHTYAGKSHITPYRPQGHEREHSPALSQSCRSPVTYNSKGPNLLSRVCFGTAVLGLQQLSRVSFEIAAGLPVECSNCMSTYMPCLAKQNCSSGSAGCRDHKSHCALACPKLDPRLRPDDLETGTNDNKKQCQHKQGITTQCHYRHYCVSGAAGCFDTAAGCFDTAPAGGCSLIEVYL